jgi:prolyl-tRNA synthetase
MNGLADEVVRLLDEIQRNMYDKALDFRTKNTFKADTWEEFKAIIETSGGFVSAHWDGTAETEMKIKEETKATIRCIPLDNTREEGKCIYSGRPSVQRVLFAQAY